ncbi:unnamed protein product [Camellia sinensis]
MQPFVIFPMVNDANMLMSTFVFKDTYIALSLANAIMLPEDKKIFRGKHDVVAIAMVTQSMIWRIANIGRQHCQVVTLISQLNEQVVSKEKKVHMKVTDLVVATKSAAAKRTRTEAEQTENIEKLHLPAKEKMTTVEALCKVAEKDLRKVRAQITEVQQTTTDAFKKGEKLTTNYYVDKVQRFENRGFKHGWTKALAVAKVTLDVPIPFKMKALKFLTLTPSS